MFFREKLQIAFGVLGVGLVAMGGVFVVPRGAPEAQPIAPVNRGVGFWKENQVGPEMKGRYGPWLIGGGVASLGLALMMRQR